MTTIIPPCEVRLEWTRERMYKTLGYGALTKMADMLGVRKTYLSHVLAGRKKSAPLLERIKDPLDNYEEQT